MSELLQLARPEIIQMHAYNTSADLAAPVRMHANEAPWRSPGDATDDGLNRYPAPRPRALTVALADYYGVSRDELLVTRGSSDGIDLLIRCFCRPGIDSVLICPPAFEMYQVYAEIQGAGVTRVPLDKSRGFALPLDGIAEQLKSNPKLLFLCSPNNPTGNILPLGELEQLCDRTSDRALVVVDGAYAEFSRAGADISALRSRHPNLIWLRSLSKALSLAGARCGAMLADPVIIKLIDKILPPYAFPTPSADAAIAALQPAALHLLRERLTGLITTRERLAEQLLELAPVRRVWPSETNFLLVEVDKPQNVVKTADRAGILLRDVSNQPGLEGCIRITVDTEQNNQALIAALSVGEL